jgi:hypothetical protein
MSEYPWEKKPGHGHYRKYDEYTNDPYNAEKIRLAGMKKARVALERMEENERLKEISNSICELESERLALTLKHNRE